MGRPCVFFDRDGIVNEPPDPERYVTGPDRFRLIPQFIEALHVVSRRRYPAVVVTNQRGVSLNVMRMEDVDRIHENLRLRLEEHGLGLLDILVSPYDDDAHPWRKPNPGMLEEAARRHNLDLSASWMIGDSERDIEAGRRAGCRTVRVTAAAEETSADHRVENMTELVAFLDEHLTPQDP